MRGREGGQESERRRWNGKAERNMNMGSNKDIITMTLLL